MNNSKINKIQLPTIQNRHKDIDIQHLNQSLKMIFTTNKEYFDNLILQHYKIVKNNIGRIIIHPQ